LNAEDTLESSDQTSGETASQPSEGEYDASLNIYQRIQRVKRDVSGVDKRGKHTQGFRFVTHDDVTAALSGLFVKYGIDRRVSVLEATREGQLLKTHVEVSWINIDRPEDRKSVNVYAEGVDPSSKGFIDGLSSGKAISYAVKMAELKNFCLVGDSAQDNERSAPRELQQAPSASEYDTLRERYKSCSTLDELKAIRTEVSKALSQLTKEQGLELQNLDLQAKERSK
jgi:hypothetical protein